MILRFTVTSHATIDLTEEVAQESLTPAKKEGQVSGIPALLYRDISNQSVGFLAGFACCGTPTCYYAIKPFYHNARNLSIATQIILLSRRQESFPGESTECRERIPDTAHEDILFVRGRCPEAVPKDVKYR